MNQLTHTFPEAHSSDLKPACIRSAMERAIGLEQLSLAPASLPYFREAARITDVQHLRDRLTAKHGVYFYGADARGNRVFDFQAFDRHQRAMLRVARVCDWAKRRMKKADDAFALTTRRFAPEVSG